MSGLGAMYSLNAQQKKLRDRIQKITLTDKADGYIAKQQDFSNEHGIPGLYAEMTEGQIKLLNGFIDKYLAENVVPKLNVKRSIVITHNDGTPDKELEICKASRVNNTKNEFIYLEKMDNGQWRLSYTAATIPEFSSVVQLVVQRENVEQSGK